MSQHDASNEEGALTHAENSEPDGELVPAQQEVPIPKFKVADAAQVRRTRILRELLGIRRRAKKAAGPAK